jgi:hypothetical protein
VFEAVWARFARLCALCAVGYEVADGH